MISRYTEAKLSKIAYEALLSDIKEDTVDFQANFDGNEMEPLVLPARVPMLLLNGASGIAVGMATNIPPHNLGELCDAVVALVQNPEISDEALFKIIPAPDFPTGGQIMGLAGAEELYKTGILLLTFILFDFFSPFIYLLILLIYLCIHLFMYSFIYLSH